MKPKDIYLLQLYNVCCESRLAEKLGIVKRGRAQEQRLTLQNTRAKVQQTNHWLVAEAWERRRRTAGGQLPDEKMIGTMMKIFFAEKQKHMPNIVRSVCRSSCNGLLKMHGMIEQPDVPKFAERMIQAMISFCGKEISIDANEAEALRHVEKKELVDRHNAESARITKAWLDSTQTQHHRKKYDESANRQKKLAAQRKNEYPMKKMSFVEVHAATKRLHEDLQPVRKDKHYSDEMKIQKFCRLFLHHAPKSYFARTKKKISYLEMCLQSYNPAGTQIDGLRNFVPRNKNCEELVRTAREGGSRNTAFWEALDEADGMSASGWHKRSDVLGFGAEATRSGSTSKGWIWSDATEAFESICEKDLRFYKEMNEEAS